MAASPHYGLVMDRVTELYAYNLLQLAKVVRWMAGGPNTVSMVFGLDGGAQGHHNLQIVAFHVSPTK